ncbi:MAG: hypothetical protein R2867_46200 [Caldilineaceae bacterium]
MIHAFSRRSRAIARGLESRKNGDQEGARRHLLYALFNYPVDAVVVNRILPGIVSRGTDEAVLTEAE